MQGLRRALDDDSGSPTFIETVRWRGYRYNGRIDVDGESDPAERATLLVSPFEDLSGDHRWDRLADRITIEVAAVLDRLRAVRVLAHACRSAGENASGHPRADVVDLVLEGCTRVQESRVRTTARLVDGTDRMQLWADRREHDVADLFAVEDAVAAMVSAAVGTVLGEPSRGGESTRGGR